MGKKQNIKTEKEKFRGKNGFEIYYSNLFGERWAQLKNALFSEQIYSEWNGGGNEKYFLDPASVFAAMQLPVLNGKKFLDMCAAPGGKTLVIAARMDEDAALVSNERSAQRKMRLAKVCDSCLSENIKQRVKIVCSDAAKWCKTQSEVYDRILLDAPCSSERHVLQDEKYLSEWSPARIKSLAMEQWSLLSCAFRLLEKGGFLLYSTCALCPAENDEIIARLLKKFENAKLVFTEKMPEISEDFSSFCKMSYIPVPERTNFGFHILPDKNNGCGPIWFSLVQKV